jgi:hypothetical protein
MVDAQNKSFAQAAAGDERPNSNNNVNCVLPAAAFILCIHLYLKVKKSRRAKVAVIFAHFRFSVIFFLRY